MADVEVQLGERLGDPVEHADTVTGAHLDDGAPRRCVVVHLDRGVGDVGGGGAHPRVVRMARSARRCSSASRPFEHAVEVVTELLPVGRAHERFDHELVDRHAVAVAPRPGRADVLAVQGEQADDGREQPRPVRADEREVRAVTFDQQAATCADHQARRAVVELRLRLVGRVVQEIGHPPHQLGDQLRLPRRPRRRSGGERVGLGEGGEQLQRLDRADGVRHHRDRRRIGEVAAGRDRRQQQVVTHEIDEHRLVGWREAHPFGDPHPSRRRAHQVDPGGGVVARVPLAQVVQPGTDEQQVGTGDASRELRRLGRRLHQVAIDGEGVEGVALRLVAHRRPLREDARDQVVLIERLEHLDRLMAGTEERDESVAGGAATARRAPERGRRAARAWSSRSARPGVRRPRRPAASSWRRTAWRCRRARRRRRAARARGRSSCPVRCRGRRAGERRATIGRASTTRCGPRTRGGTSARRRHRCRGRRPAGPATRARVDRSPARRCGATRRGRRATAPTRRARPGRPPGAGRRHRGRGSTAMSRSPPRPSFSSGSSRKPSSPATAWRSRTNASRRASEPGARRCHCAPARVVRSFANGSSPATNRASTSPSSVLKSLSATASASATVRTLWSSFTCASQIGYQIRSAMVAMSRGLVCSSRRSMSLPGHISPRP